MAFYKFIVLPFLLIPISVLCQLNVKFILKERPANHNSETVYVAGNFNNWNAADNNYRITAKEDNTLVIKLPAGSYQYKLTRGTWIKVEAGKDGTDLDNRVLPLTKDTIINISILSWKDDFKTEPVKRKNTASINVSVMDTAFYIPQLNRTRRIWVYLPQSYASDKKKYPVIYMHDGQNLFDEATSGFGEWGVDEALDTLSEKGYNKAIIVGIDNGPKRMNEYNPYEFRSFGKGEGDKYGDFIANTLKPYIDNKYRTLSNKKNTFIAGSSMGGLISLYAVMIYPKVFGGAGIFSPAFWSASGLHDDLSKMGKKMQSKLFFYAGGKEGDSMIPEMKSIKTKIKTLPAYRRTNTKTYQIVDMEAKHNEAAWRKHFPEFYKWILN